MSDFDSILSSAQGGQLISNLAARFGLTEEQIQSAINALLPALSMGLHRAAEEPQTLGKTLGALEATNRYSFFDDHDAAHSEDSVTLGRDLVTEMFGSQAATGQILQAAARESGVRPDILGQLLPVLASVLLSGLTKSLNEQGLGNVLGQLANSGGLGGILEQILGGAAGQAPQTAPAPRGNPGGLPGGLPGGAAGGGLGGLLGGLLGSLLGGGRGADPRSGGSVARGPSGGGYDPLDSSVSRSGPSGLPGGLDQASLQDAIEQIKKTLQVGQNNANSSAPSGRPQGGTDLEAILGQILGKR
jgi:hypothetical protein